MKRAPSQADLDDAALFRRNLLDAAAKLESADALKKRLWRLPPGLHPLGNPTKPLLPCCGWPVHLPWCQWGETMPGPA